MKSLRESKMMNKELLQKPNKYGFLSIQRCKSSSKVRQQGNQGLCKKKTTSKHPVVTPKQICKRSAEFSNVVSPSLSTNSDGDDVPPTKASMASDSRSWSHSAITVLCIQLSIRCARVIDGYYFCEVEIAKLSTFSIYLNTLYILNKYFPHKKLVPRPCGANFM
jgi:hypothetical protein